jgi:hypothetical protein
LDKRKVLYNAVRISKLYYNRAQINEIPKKH